MASKIILTIYILVLSSIGYYFGLCGFSQIKLLQELETIKKQNSDKPYIKSDSVSNQDSSKIKYTIVINGKTLSFDNINDMKTFIEQSHINNISPWSNKLPEFFILIITSTSFGLLGGTILVIKKIVYNQLGTDYLPYFLQPILSSMTGIIVLGLSYVIPSLIFAEVNDLRPTTLVLLTLFSGLFSENFFDWLGNHFSSFFNSDSNLIKKANYNIRIKLFFYKL